MREKVTFFLFIFLTTFLTILITPSPALKACYPNAKITFKSDIPFSKQEFFYLTDLKKEIKNLLEQDLSHAKKQLKRKKRFSIIDVKIKKEKKLTKIHFNLVGNWIFKQVNISGILFGKYRYENFYLQHPGDIFDISLHEESTNLIKKNLYEKGYFDCSLTDEIIYNKKEKTISTKISIKKGPLFYIDKINFRINKTKNINFKKIEKKLFLIFSGIINKRCSKKFLTKVKNRISFYLKKRGFSKSNVLLKKRIKKNQNKVELSFEIKIGKKLLLEFVGNKFFTSEDIKKDILDDEKPDWLLDKNIIGEQILHKYYNHGFWATKIRCEKVENDYYKFYIDEGKRKKIKKVIIKDVDTGKIEINKFFFQQVLDGKFYNEKLLNQSIENLSLFYVKHGFWDFSIKSKKLINNSMFLETKKGKQRFLDGIPLDPSLISNKKLSILKDYQKQGFWYADAKPKFETISTIKKENFEIEDLSIDWEINPGQKVKFGKIFLRGNTKLPFNRIKKEIQFKQGDLWDRKKLDYSRKKLKNLGIFKHIEIHPKKISNKQSEKPILLTLLDDDPIELKFRTGYFLTSKNFLLKRESTYKFGSSVLIKNQLNFADKLSLDVNFTRFEKNFDLDYTIPHAFFESVIGKFKIYHHKYIHPLQVGKSDAAYQAIQSGFLVGMAKEYKPQSFWGMNIGNEFIKTSKTRGNLKLSKNMINKTIPYFFFEPNIVIDNLDDKINTKKGSLTFSSIKIMVPEINRSINYKIMVDRSMFFPIIDDFIFAMRIRLGHIFRRKFEEIMPIERFYLGGPYSVRGYSKDTVPPLGKASTGYTIQGGSSMVNGNFELRFPIYKSFGGVVFQDLGMLKKIYPTSGFGFRYQTPIGALRFDIGWKWKKYFSKEPSYAWYLTLGQAF